MYIHSYTMYAHNRTSATYGHAKTGMGVPRLRLQAYLGYSYGRTMTAATGVLRLRLLANVQAYYVHFFAVYTVYA